MPGAAWEIRALDPKAEPDIRAAFEISRDCEVAVLGSSDETYASVVSMITGPKAWRDSQRLAFIEGRPVGVLLAEIDRDGRESFIDALAIGPEAPDIQRALLLEVVALVRQVAQDDPQAGSANVSDPYELSADFWQVVAGAHAEDHVYADVLLSLGFRPIRRFWRMICDLTGVDATEPAAPVGVTRRVVDGPDDRRELHRLYYESFAEHFGMTHVQDVDSWLAELEASAGHDPGRWWLAELDGRPVGFCISDDSRAEFGEGYVPLIGVASSARGRGIARWLLRCAAADAVRRGRTAIGLSVDGANTTGATALYESVGYVIRYRLDAYCLPIDANDSSRNVSPQT